MTTTTETERMAAIEDYVSQHYLQELRMDDIAAQVGLTTTSLSRFFRHVTGKRLSQYILELRMAHICRLLRETDQPVSDICFSSGFNTLSNFNRLFKRYYGCTPTEYRNHLINNKI